MSDLEKETLLILSKLSKGEISELCSVLKKTESDKSRGKCLHKVFEINVVCECRLCGSVYTHKAVSAFPKDIKHRAPTCNSCKTVLLSGWTTDMLVEKLIDVCSLGDPTTYKIQKERPMPEYIAPFHSEEVGEPISLELVEHDKELEGLIEEVVCDVVVEEEKA